MLLKKQDNRRGNINPRFMRGLFNGKWACNTTWRGRQTKRGVYMSS